MITLGLFGKEITINTHDVEGEMLYRAQDLLVAGAGMPPKKASNAIKHWKEHERHLIGKVSVLGFVYGEECSDKNLIGENQTFEEKDEQNQHITNKGKSELNGIVNFRGNTGGTYLTEDMVYKLAAYVDKGFYDAVFKAFAALVRGNTNEALDAAAQVAISKELIDKIDKYVTAIQNEIPIWDGKQSKQRGKAAFTIIHNHIIAKTCAGTTATEVKKFSSATSLKEYFIKNHHVSGLGAYLATLKLVLPMLKGGVDYYLIKDILLDDYDI